MVGIGVGCFLSVVSVFLGEAKRCKVRDAGGFSSAETLAFDKSATQARKAALGVARCVCCATQEGADVHAAGSPEGSARGDLAMAEGGRADMRRRWTESAVVSRPAHARGTARIHVEG